MKKRFLLVVSICIVLALSACSLSAGRRNTAFRNTCWGDDIETIKKEENIPITYNSFLGRYVSENQKFADYNVSINYNVDSNYGLYGGFYVFDISHDSALGYVSEYEKIKSSLIKMYGEPTNIYEDPAFLDSMLLYNSAWENSIPDTSIILILSDSYDSSDASITLEYLDTRYSQDKK